MARPLSDATEARRSARPPSESVRRPSGSVRRLSAEKPGLTGIWQTPSSASREFFAREEEYRHAEKPPAEGRTGWRRHAVVDAPSAAARRRAERDRAREGSPSPRNPQQDSSSVGGVHRSGSPPGDDPPRRGRPRALPADAPMPDARLSHPPGARAGIQPPPLLLPARALLFRRRLPHRDSPRARPRSPHRPSPRRTALTAD